MPWTLTRCLSLLRLESKSCYYLWDVLESRGLGPLWKDYNMSMLCAWAMSVLIADRIGVCSTSTISLQEFANDPSKAMFSPLAFPEGLVLYDLSTTLPPPSHLALAPFEIYREPLVVVGIADGRELEVDSVKARNPKGHGSAGAGIDEHANNGYDLDSLSRDFIGLQEEYSRALLHQVLVFDHDFSSLPKDIYPVPSPEKSRTTTVKTVMCDLTSRLLAEMTTFAKSLQSLPSLDTPRVPPGSASLNGIASSLPAHMTGLSRPGSVIENSRSSSPIDDRPGPSHRMSTPITMPLSSGSQTTPPDSRATSPPSGARSPPRTFNEINGISASQSPPKPSSHGNPRAGSRDRMSVNGLSANSLGERERKKAKCRVGVVVGAMYLLAGRWPDAVKELVQSATTARGNSDYIWYAKAMDYILVCLLMYAWAGMEFRVSLHNIDESNLYTLAQISRKKLSHLDTRHNFPEFGQNHFRLLKIIEPRSLQ